MDLIVNQERRASRRNYTSLSAIVKGQDGDDIFWKETAMISTVSKTGASFNLLRECKIGRLISLIMPMPADLRSYDTDAELYRVWGLVQHCNPILTEEFECYQIGIAFIGKNAPESFKLNPLQSYRISGVDENGLWNAIEAKREFVSRKHPRFVVSLEVNLAALDGDGNILAAEDTTTENISLSGAAVFSTLNVKIGSQINYTCRIHDFSSLAVVRNIKTVDARMSILNLEFVKNLFPIRETFLPNTEIEELIEV